jgi:Kef-type K+ transport system membrane component KefB
LSNNNAEMLQWLGVVVLAFMTQLAIAMVHLDRSAPQRMALGLFSIAAVFTICVVGAYERPFDGPLSISADPLAEILEQLQSQKEP